MIMDETKYEMIICIVNAGYSGSVMESAKKEGAGGGTVIHARGTADKEAEEFFRIAIQPEKEVVIMVVPEAIKDNVLRAIYEKNGLETEGQGIAFSVPVLKAVGLSYGKNEAAEKT